MDLKILLKKFFPTISIVVIILCLSLMRVSPRSGIRGYCGIVADVLHDLPVGRLVGLGGRCLWSRLGLVVR